MKSMTAKLRQAAKQDINNYKFDDKSGKLEKKDDLKDIRHNKSLNEKQFILDLFARREFQTYMHNHYQIVPMLLSYKKIRKVIILLLIL